MINLVLLMAICFWMHTFWPCLKNLNFHDEMIYYPPSYMHHNGFMNRLITYGITDDQFKLYLNFIFLICYFRLTILYCYVFDIEFVIVIFLMEWNITLVSSSHNVYTNGPLPDSSGSNHYLPLYHIFHFLFLVLHFIFCILKCSWGDGWHILLNLFPRHNAFINGPINENAKVQKLSFSKFSISWAFMVKLGSIFDPGINQL